MTAEELIPIYHGLFYACMAGALLFAAAAAVIFFRFDIRHIFNVQSGRAERMTVERMRAENAATGRLILTAETELAYSDGVEQLLVELRVYALGHAVVRHAELLVIISRRETYHLWNVFVVFNLYKHDFACILVALEL